MIRSVMACLILAALAVLWGCSTSLFGSTGGGGGSTGGGSGAAQACGSWWTQIAGLGVLNWMGGLLILLGGIAFVGTFIPAVGAFFPKKMSVSCVIAGVASVLFYNLLTEYLWVVYTLLLIGGVLLAATYWKSITAMAVKVWELVRRKDLDGDGEVGPKDGAD